ncbi:MAG: RelA/SpoT family protein [Chloroflexota bacterium]|nr:RelA/SpoT family protein [Chloroflexota bacterium]
MIIDQQPGERTQDTSSLASSERTPDVDESIWPGEAYNASLDASAQRLLGIIHEYMPVAEVEQIARALLLAQQTCRGERGTRLLPPLEHALAIATILAEMRIDAVGVTAGLIFEALDADLLPLERVGEELGAPVERVVSSMLRLNILERKKQAGAHLATPRAEADNGREHKKRRNREILQRLQAETVRKMFLAMADDPRVVLLKLAYRLHAMRVLRHPDFPYDPHEKQTMAQETREIYAPLAGRLGMSRVESELEDLAFEILEPQRYAWIYNLIEAEKKQWEGYVERVCTILRAEMASIGLRTEVSGRVKHLYSFYKKLLRSIDIMSSSEHLSAEQLAELDASAHLQQIHDVIAFRILAETTPDCYLALGHIHSMWKPKEGRIKDFIANPKPNGYSALHTTVFCLDEQLVEIQIRTFTMHEMAEYGVAMHWHYKDVGDHASASAKELLAWLRQLAEWQRELRSPSTSDSEFVEAVKGDIFQEQIFIFTPRGEVKDLPVGSTPLDFAYRIHSKVGDNCAGARIITDVGQGDGERLVTRMVPLDYELKNGEIVDIVTSRTAHPTRDWLNFARTAAARSKIRRYLKIHERDINIQIGRERLDRELKVVGLRGLEVLTEDIQNWLIEEYKQASFDDLLAATGSDEIRQHAVAVKVSERLQQLREMREGKEAKDGKDEDESFEVSTSSKQLSSVKLQVAGVSGLLTRLANCCCPLPGDEIVGFISRGKGAIVHRADCQNINRYRERERERLVNVSWAGVSLEHYLAPVTIVARDRPGLIRDIATVISEVGVNMAAVSSNVDMNKEMVVISTTLQIEGLEQMQRVFARLERVRNVIQVERDLKKSKKKRPLASL